MLEELFDQIHRTLLFMGGSYAECFGMGATLSLCWFTPGRMYFGHIGDTRIYYLPAREGGSRRLTHDDTHVGWLFRRARSTSARRAIIPRRNVLQKALGAGISLWIRRWAAVAYEAGDLFLLCTDGLVEGLYDEQLLELLRGALPARRGREPGGPARPGGAAESGAG